MSAVVAAATAAPLTWFYESIRIPTLAATIAFKDDKIKDAEARAQAAKEESTTLKAELDKEQIAVTHLQRNLEQSLSDATEMARKLEQAQQLYAKSKEDYGILKLDFVRQKTNSPVPSAFASPDALNGLPTAILMTSDQEEASVTEVGNSLLQLKLASTGYFYSEIEKCRNQPIQFPDKQVTSLIDSLHAFYGFRLTLEQLRTHTASELRKHYRTKLSKFQGLLNDAFITEIREKPAVVENIGSLSRQMLANTDAIGWNTNSTAILDLFMSNAVPRSSTEAKLKP